MAEEDPLLRHNRIEAANTLANCIIDVINEHVGVHGEHDPMLRNLLLAAIATVVTELNDKVSPDFGVTLGAMFDPPPRELV